MADQQFDEAAWLAAIVEWSDAAIISTDLNGILTSWNPAAERIYGYSAAEAIGQPNRLIIPADRHPEEEEVVRRIVAGEPVQHYDSIRVRKDGVRIDVSLTVSPLRNRHRAIIGISKISRDISAQKRAEIERTSAERHIDRIKEDSLAAARELAAIVESTDDAIIGMDLRGTITAWNRAAEQMYGYAANEAIGHSITIVLPPDRQAEEVAFLERIKHGERIVAFETVRCRKGGECFPASLTISPIRDEKGSVVGVSKIARDISTRKRAEERFRLAVEAAPTAMLIVDEHGAIVFANGLAERLFGYTREELLEKSIEALVPDRYRAVHPRHRAHFYTELSRRPMGAGRELHALRKDGCEVPVEIGLSPFESDGNVCVLAAITDISERKRASQHAAFLAEAGAILAGSLEYLTTLKGVANLAVPSIADWCAVDIMTEEHKLERLAVAHVDPDKIDLARTIRSRYEDPNSPFSPIYVVRTGNPAMMKELSDEMIVAAAQGDAERVALIRALGLRSYMIVPLTAHGRTFGALTFATAESGRLYSEDDLRFAQDIAFRAALAVDNARAYHDAQTANRLKDEFLATLSHELRTPLNAILGYTRLLQSGMIEADKRSRALVTVERNASALTQIVEDILDVSRIISGKIRLSIQPVDVSQVVKNAVETMTPAADAKQIRVQTILDPRAGPISGDPDRLLQVVWNLLSNAVKFTPKQGIVQMRVERINSHVEIVVSDTGIGIAPDFLPHIFERFRQADSGTTRAHGGIGLGLAIVRHLIELHGGTIHVASGGKDQGSTFRVRLPLMIVHSDTTSDRRAHAPDAAGTSAPLPRLDDLRILAVDDDADARALVTETLEAAGATVTAVDSVAMVDQRLAADRPDVLLADIGMVESDGFELIRRVRESGDPRVRDIPAAALTAYARAEDRMKALQAGFQMHLAKPVDPAELIIAVATLARQRIRPSGSTEHG